MNWQVTACLAAFAVTALGSGCAGSPQTTGNNGGSGPGDSTGGKTGTGSGGGGGSGDGSGGRPSNGSGGTQGNGGFDDGTLFGDAAPPAPADASVSSGDASSDANGQGSGMAVKMFPALNITLSFTQKGTDVTLVATHKGCGPITIQIHNGFSCDNLSTQGGIWDGKRGDGITGSVACDAAQIGKLTYTRPGSDPTLNWTVGDHNAKTDVTYHPIFVDGNCLTFF
jgi:hypothetical protein